MDYLSALGYGGLDSAIFAALGFGGLLLVIRSVLGFSGLVLVICSVLGLHRLVLRSGPEISILGFGGLVFRDSLCFRVWLFVFPNLRVDKILTQMLTQSISN